MSISFDRVSEVYDQTRGLPAAVAEQVAQAVVEIAGDSAHNIFLEVGVGTGRMALPIARLGPRYVGIDLSLRMMDRLRAKDARGLVHLVYGDMTQLPFSAGMFDAVLAVHVFHLVPNWKEALREIRRVLKPEGVLLHSSTGEGEETVRRQIRHEWRRLVAEAGITSRRPGAGSGLEVQDALVEMGAQIEQVEMARWVEKRSVGSMLEFSESHTHSDSWRVPDDVFLAAGRQVREWTTERFGPLETLVDDPHEFRMMVARFR